MKTTIPPSTARVESATAAVPACCEVVIAYADAPSARKAMKVYERLQHEFAEDLDFICTWWKFDQFLEPESFAAASHAAVHADLVLLATPAQGELPPMTKAWMNAWAPREDGQPRALIALLGCDDGGMEESSPVDEYLQVVARNCRMDYFALWFELPAHVHGISQPDIAQRADTVTPLLAEILAKPEAQPHRWNALAN